MARRAPKKRYTDDILRRIFESDEPYDLGKLLGVPKSTVATLLKRGTPERKRRGGVKPMKMTEAHEEFVINLIEEKPDLSLQEVSDYLYAEFGVRVSPQTVSRHLDGRCFTLKALRVELNAVNSDTNKAKRVTWSNKYLNLVGDGYVPVFQDESNFNQHIRRGKGRARKGERAIAVMPATRGANIHCVASISSLQLLSFSTHLGSLKADDFGRYLNEIAEGLDRFEIHKAVVNIDNAPWHCRAEEQWAEICERFAQDGILRDWKLLRLAPYSYSCSAIELFWSAFKAGVKHEFRERRAEILNLVLPAGGETLTARRTRILTDVAQHQSVVNADVRKLQAYFQKVQGTIARASNGEDMPIGQ